MAGVVIPVSKYTAKPLDQFIQFPNHKHRSTDMIAPQGMKALTEGARALGFSISENSDGKELENGGYVFGDRLLVLDNGKPDDRFVGLFRECAAYLIGRSKATARGVEASARIELPASAVSDALAEQLKYREELEAQLARETNEKLQVIADLQTLQAANAELGGAVANLNLERNDAIAALQAAQGENESLKADNAALRATGGS